MFSTCLFCHGSLGANDTIEHFPVGKRLAFDGDRGRLWAVCPRCARWNLAPIEERWEALEECEKAYRAATKRVSTDNIALARLKDGTDLVRIGQPLLPEFAAWRYGGRYLARQRRELAVALGSQSVYVTAMSTKWMFGAAMPIGVLAGMGVIAAAMQWGAIAAEARRRWLPRGIVHTTEHGPRAVTYGDSKATRVRLDEAGQMSIGLRSRPVVPAPRPLRALGFRYLWTGGAASESWHGGTEALTMLAPLLGASHLQTAFGRRQIDEAVNVMVERVQRVAEPPDQAAVRMLTDQATAIGRPGAFPNGRPLDSIPTRVRLAAEMALHEDDERRALAGELGALYARWEEAERIARIADGELTRLPDRE
jgi:hypothetical protein